jgi:glycosyltransferase involved in cell wall biosynthesis
MRLSLAVTTFEQPSALAAVLDSVRRQRAAPDEVIVADDGSGEPTRAVIEAFTAVAGCPVHYVRQEHDGFRVARLRNLAIARARGKLVVFIDGDMLLHPEFIADHRRHAQHGAWTQGVRIPQRGPGLRGLYALHAPRVATVLRKVANAFIAVKSCNMAVWREDLVAVNGFNEEFVGWGPEDKELAARLAHRGIRRQTLLFGGIAWHLHHAAASRARRAANEAIYARTLAQRLARCERGLDAHL